MGRTVQSDAVQQAFLEILRAEGAIVEEMQQIAARATDSVVRGLFEHLRRKGRNVFFVKDVGLINVHVRSESRGWWNILKLVKDDFAWLKKDHRINHYFVLLVGRKDKFVADGYIASDFSSVPFVTYPSVQATKFTINENQHLQPDERILSIAKVAKTLLQFTKR